MILNELRQNTLNQQESFEQSCKRNNTSLFYWFSNINDLLNQLKPAHDKQKDWVRVESFKWTCNSNHNILLKTSINLVHKIIG